MIRRPLFAVAAAGAVVFALAGPALPAQANLIGSGTGAPCFDPVAAGARGGTSLRAGDTREITAAEQLRIERATARILDTKLVSSLTGLLKGAVASKGKPGGGGSGGGTDPAGAALGNIPVYVHQMLSKSGAGRVTTQQINDQIAEMNQDYAGQDANAHTGSTTDQTTKANTGAHFYLAGVDEYFNDTWHKDRQSTTYRAQTRQGGKKSLNIWLVDFSYLGIATFPWDYNANPSIDGIRVQWDSLPGGDITHYNLGKTATHEAGHWLGLYHTFQGGCTATNDEVADTPAQQSSTTGCPEGRDSCTLPGLDPIHNYMDYSYDECYDEFTPNQASRIQSMWTAYRA
ncbi:MAG TPA: zinc metalloprotease [Marmoricola sp.]|nr:zinc metalloprotease [Marmoricola sp.]